jgi:predicted anti-sigma-YlaC factor YlaD
MKRDCGFIQENLLDYVYHELNNAKLKKDIDEHIKECPECVEKVEQYREIESTVKEMKVEFSDSVWELHRRGIHEKLNRKEPGLLNNFAAFLKHFFSLRQIGVALLVLLLAGVGTQYFRGVQSTEDQRIVTEQMDMFQNMEIIERLEFYTQISEKGDL